MGFIDELTYDKRAVSDDATAYGSDRKSWLMNHEDNGRRRLSKVWKRDNFHTKRFERRRPLLC